MSRKLLLFHFILGHNLIIDTFFSICKQKKYHDNKIRNSCRKGMVELLSYSPLWKTMERRGITTYTLIVEYGVNPRTINNLKHNRSITMITLERLCKILNCSPNDVVTFEESTDMEDQ